MDLVLRTMPRPRAARPQDKHPAARRDPRRPKVPALSLRPGRHRAPRTKVDPLRRAVFRSQGRNRGVRL